MRWRAMKPSCEWYLKEVSGRTYISTSCSVLIIGVEKQPTPLKPCPYCKATVMPKSAMYQ